MCPHLEYGMLWKILPAEANTPCLSYVSVYSCAKPRFVVWTPRRLSWTTLLSVITSLPVLVERSCAKWKEALRRSRRRDGLGRGGALSSPVNKTTCRSFNTSWFSGLCAVLALKIPSSHPIFFARAALLLNQQQLCNSKEAEAKRNWRTRTYESCTESRWQHCRDEVPYSFKILHGTRVALWRRRVSALCRILLFSFMWFQLPVVGCDLKSSKWKLLEKKIPHFKIIYIMVTVPCCY